MKTFALTAALCLVASATLAGSPDTAVIDPTVIEAETSSANGHILVPILAIIFIGAGVAG